MNSVNNEILNTGNGVAISASNAKQKLASFGTNNEKKVGDDARGPTHQETHLDEEDVVSHTVKQAPNIRKIVTTDGVEHERDTSSSIYSPPIWYHEKD